MRRIMQAVRENVHAEESVMTVQIPDSKTIISRIFPITGRIEGSKTSNLVKLDKKYVTPKNEMPLIEAVA